MQRHRGVGDMKRKRFSIKSRMTIWYVSFLVLLVSIVFFVLLSMSNRLIQNNIKSDLIAVVENSERDVFFQQGKLQIDDDIVSYWDGIYVLVYEENNFIVIGDLPDGITWEIPFISDQVRRIEDSGKAFYVYDHCISTMDSDDAWIRGITRADMAGTDPGAAFMRKLFFVSLPILMLVAAIGGYFIAKRAFRPVAQITETARDITARADLSQRIELELDGHSKDEIYHLASVFDKMLDRLERSFEAEKQFSNDASHELRTPISVIIAQCEYALKKADAPEEAQAALEVILGQSKKMSALISQLLTLARADQGTLKLQFEELCVSDLASMAALEQEGAAARRKIEIQQEIEPDIIWKVDETLFLRLWMNLISNGIKYGREGGFIRIVLKQNKGFLMGQVIDNGMGIHQEEIPKIWDRFYQINPSRSDENSAGLGLSMVKWIVSAHGGTISVNSTLNEGSEFTFLLPIDTDSDLQKEREDL